MTTKASKKHVWLLKTWTTCQQSRAALVWKASQLIAMIVTHAFERFQIKPSLAAWVMPVSWLTYNMPRQQRIHDCLLSGWADTRCYGSGCLSPQESNVSLEFGVFFVGWTRFQNKRRFKMRSEELVVSQLEDWRNLYRPISYLASTIFGNFSFVQSGFNCWALLVFLLAQNKFNESKNSTWFGSGTLVWVD